MHIWDEITVSLRVENLQIQSSKKRGGSIYVGLIEVIKEFSKGFLCMYRLLYGYKDTVRGLCMDVASPRVINLFSVLVKLSYDQRLNYY